MIQSDYPPVGFAILRSLEDGHQTVGPPLRDAAGVRVYLAYIRGLKPNLFRVEGVVWVRDKLPPEGWGLWAEPIEDQPPAGAARLVLLGSRRK